MANCKSCTHSIDYFDPKDRLTKLICLSPQKETMATLEGEHDCVAYRLNEWDEKRQDVVGQNGNTGDHYGEI